MEEYTLFCDESSSTGKIFTDFFGGCIVKESMIPQIVADLEAKKIELGITAEIKWTKVSEDYVEKYIELIKVFFKYVRSGDIRVRIMFRKTANQYAHDDRPAKAERYTKLYYQFLRNSFGFNAPAAFTGEYYVHFLLDELPTRKDQADKFKDYLCALPNTIRMMESGLHIRKRDIGEVKSHDHVIMQCVDVILGSMNFKLNKLDRVIPEGQKRRGKKTVAKEKVYKHILSEIRSIHPRFNIGVSTNARGYKYPHWSSPYEHWEFIPYEIK